MENNNITKYKKKFAIIITVALIFVIIYLILFELPIFKLKKIEVVGNEKLSYNDIKDLAGITYGMSIFKISTNKVQNELLKNPYIKDCKIKIKYPSTILIDINERKIIAQIPYQLNYLMIDSEGVVVKSGEYDPKLPVINGIKIKKYEVGKKINNIFDKSFIGALLNSIENKDFLKEITYVNQNNIIVSTKSGINISFTAPYDINYSVKYAELILKDLIKKGYNRGTIQIVGNNNPVFLP